MNRPSRIREGAYTVGFTVAVTAICISAVSALQVLTREQVALNAKLYLQRAVMEASGVGLAEQSTVIQEWYAKSVEERRIPGGPVIYVVRAGNGGVQSYVFRIQGTGLWGAITAAVGLGKDLEPITGISFVEHNETPGLGARIEEPVFKRQFLGRKGPFSIAAGPAAGEERMDAITGATITSRGVRDMLNSLRVNAAAWVKAAGESGPDGKPEKGSVR